MIVVIRRDFMMKPSCIKVEKYRSLEYLYSFLIVSAEI